MRLGVTVGVFVAVVVVLIVLPFLSWVNGCQTGEPFPFDARC